jgi:hypothetical protein
VDCDNVLILVNKYFCGQIGRAPVESRIKKAPKVNGASGNPPV